MPIDRHADWCEFVKTSSLTPGCFRCEAFARDPRSLADHQIQAIWKRGESDDPADWITSLDNAVYMQLSRARILSQRMGWIPYPWNVKETTT